MPVEAPASSDSMAANVTESRVLRVSQVFSGFLRFSQAMPGPERGQTDGARCALTRRDS